MLDFGENEEEFLFEVGAVDEDHVHSDSEREGVHYFGVEGAVLGEQGEVLLDGVVLGGAPLLDYGLLVEQTLVLFVHHDGFFDLLNIVVYDLLYFLIATQIHPIVLFHLPQKTVLHGSRRELL